MVLCYHCWIQHISCCLPNDTHGYDLSLFLLEPIITCRLPAVLSYFSILQCPFLPALPLSFPSTVNSLHRFDDLQAMTHTYIPMRRVSSCFVSSIACYIRKPSSLTFNLVLSSILRGFLRLHLSLWLLLIYLQLVMEEDLKAALEEANFVSEIFGTQDYIAHSRLKLNIDARRCI